MSAWPEAIYIINKLNKALENTTTFEQDVPLINDTNRKINNLNNKIINGGLTKETEAEYRAASGITTSRTVIVRAAQANIGKEILYSEMSQQGNTNIITDEINIPTGELDDFSYIFQEDNTAVLAYIYTDYTKTDNFNTTPPALNNELDYTLQSLIRYLDAQDTYLNTLTISMNNKLDAFLENNNLVDLSELVNSTNSKMAIISTTPPIASTVNPISDYTVWLHLTTEE